MKKSNQGETRQHNSRLVLSTIYHMSEISRVDVSRRTGLTRTTVSEIVASFLEDGLLVETGLAPSTGGKPATLLRVDEDAKLLIGVDLAESEFRGGLVNLRGDIHYRMSLPLGDRDGDRALELVHTLIEGLLKQASQPIIGIGVGTPGLMDPASGVVRQAVNLNWENLPLVDLLASHFEMPVYIANDCQVAALGEYTFGALTGSDNLILIKAGRGVGAGVVLGGNLFYGDNAGAGEIGHIQVISDGQPCRCGNCGCLETVLSEPALVKRTIEIARTHPETVLNQLAPNPENISIHTVVEAYRAKDSNVVALIDSAARTLGGVVAHLAGALNINRILIAGYLRRFNNGLLGPVRQSVLNGTLPGLARHTEVALATLGDDIVIQGAASMILKNDLGVY